MHTIKVMFIGLGVLSLPVFAIDVQVPRSEVNPMVPFWRSTTMVGESVLFIRPEDSKPASGSLLFTPKQVLSVTSSSGLITYALGKDYVFNPESRVLTVPEGSSIPVKTRKDFTVPKGSQAYNLARRDGKGEILFGAAHEYADMQVLVTYTHSGKEWEAPPPRFAAEELPGVLKKLQNGDPLGIVLFGDSISAGHNASKFVRTAPFQPPYGELLVEDLRQAYKSTITFKNVSVAGQTSGWGVKNIATVATAEPDLAILAWGMNDCCQSCSASNFVANLKAQMDAVRKVNPSAEFILVASMLPNRDWASANPDLICRYRDAMKKLEGKDVAVADVTSVWEAILKVKNYFDITGNGVNHPGDFGHRVYAQVISSLLLPQEESR